MVHKPILLLLVGSTRNATVRFEVPEARRRPSPLPLRNPSSSSSGDASVLKDKEQIQTNISPEIMGEWRQTERKNRHREEKKEGKRLMSLN